MSAVMEGDRPPLCPQGDQKHARATRATDPAKLYRNVDIQLIRDSSRNSNICVYMYFIRVHFDFTSF